MDTVDSEAKADAVVAGSGGEDNQEIGEMMEEVKVEDMGPLANPVKNKPRGGQITF